MRLSAHEVGKLIMPPGMITASVPFSTLAMLPPEVLSLAIVALPSERTLIRRNRFCAPPLVPPRLLFCSLLI